MAQKVVQFKGGGVVHGPKVRSHNKKIPSKLKKQAIRILLSSKLKDGKLKIIDKLELKKLKRKKLRLNLRNWVSNQQHLLRLEN